MRKCNSCKSKIDIKVWNGTGIVNGNNITLISVNNMVIDTENCNCQNPLSEFYNSGISKNNVCNLHEYETD
ncbi:MAG: hypothetical protein K0R54_730 [Clostridiaceae bacterium]|jgi:hypothetical protein|nr:hypothetical protein [Clostridiaceae bacterium]